MNIVDKLLPTPPDFPKEKISQLRRNLHVHIGDGSIYVLGMSLVSYQTIYPVFIKELGGSAVAIGSVQVLWTLGQNIPSAFVAQYLKRRSLYTLPMVQWGFVHRVMLLISGVAAIFLIGKISTSFTVGLFLILLLLTAAFGSLSGLPWFQVYTKTVPVKLRGRLMGIRQLLGSAAGTIGASIVGIVLTVVAFPTNFALLFFGGFTFTMISFYFLTKIIEDETKSAVPYSHTRFNIIIEAKRIIRTDKNYRHYLLFDAFGLMSLAAASFYSVYALEKFSLPASYAGTFTGIVMVTNIVANIAFGIIADVYGHKINLLVYAISLFLAAVLAIISSNIFLYSFVFVFLACSIQIQMISRTQFIAEFCSESDRPLYFGITNTLTAPTVLAGVIFGWLIPAVGYQTVFLATSLIALCSFFILYRFVAEPRAMKQA